MTHLMRALLGKVLALAILALAVLGVVNWIVDPLATHLADARERIEEQRTLLGRLLATASRAGDGQPTENNDKSGDAARSYLPGESDAIRTAGLQTRLSEVAQSVGLRLASVLAVAPREQGEVRLLGIDVQLAASLEQVQKILFELETQQPYLFIDSLQISHAPDAGVRGGRDLDVRLVVLGAAARKKD